MDENIPAIKKPSVLLKVEPNNNLQKQLLVKPLKKGIPPSDLKKNTYRIEKSNILDQVKNFLPQLITSNEALLSMDTEEKEKLDIENVDECDKVIEMNLSVVDNDILLSDTDSESSDDSENESEPENLNQPTPKLIQEVPRATLNDAASNNININSKT
ncbi:NOP protein chaperone 1-like [Clytia hemisphaerica]|uniref:Uncharacterized protein n=1 Tax=Clytia hemisphaerica TaxID=252671 RepID=A0A7M5WK50_9CNID|eukprot:TCONS_00052788-protein